MCNSRVRGDGTGGGYSRARDAQQGSQIAGLLEARGCMLRSESDAVEVWKSGCGSGPNASTE